MAQLLKLEEWQSASGNWYVADVHTFTDWRAIADVFGVNSDEPWDLIPFLEQKYNAVVVKYNEEKDYLLFYWLKDDYKDAHQFKLDVNRVARKKNYLVERRF